LLAGFRYIKTSGMTDILQTQKIKSKVKVFRAAHSRRRTD